MSSDHVCITTFGSILISIKSKWIRDELEVYFINDVCPKLSTRTHVRNLCSLTLLQAALPEVSSISVFHITPVLLESAIFLKKVQALQGVTGHIIKLILKIKTKR